MEIYTGLGYDIHELIEGDFITFGWNENPT